jgi:hypothetical protein
MVFIIIVAILILAMAYYQTLDGFFSAAVMAILTVLSAGIALAYYDELGMALVDRLGAFAHGLSLLALFGIPLLVLRELFDRLIRGNLTLGIWGDRVAGGALGLVTATVLMGMLLMVAQLLPLPASILGWKPYDPTLTARAPGPPAWATRATYGWMEQLSSGSLRTVFSGDSLGELHEDFMLDTFCLRNRPEGARMSAPKDSLFVERVFELAPEESATRPASRETIDHILKQTPGYRAALDDQEQERTKVLVARVKVDELARNEQDNWFRLPATHFRMVTRDGRSYYPVGYLTYAGTWQVNTSRTEGRTAKVAEIVVRRPWRQKGGPAELVIDWLYRVPADAQPDYMVFRRVARRPVTAVTTGRLSSQDAMTALFPKPLSGESEFGSAATDTFLRPTKALVDDRVPDRTNLAVDTGSLPEAIRTWEVKNDRVQAARIVGNWTALREAREGRRTSRLGAGRSGRQVLKVRFEVAPGQKLPAARLARISPHLLLQNGQAVPSIGAIVLYQREPRMIHWYYDADRKPGSPSSFEPAWAETLVEHAGEVNLLTVFFAAPPGPIPAVGLRLQDDQGHEMNFYLERPLSLE